MAYEKQEWKTGDTITAEKMNHIEDGVADSPFFTVTITYSNNNYTSDKTYNEIEQAFLAGKLVRAIFNGGIYYLVRCGTEPGNEYDGAQFRSFSYFGDSDEGVFSESSLILFVTISNQVVLKVMKI